MSEKFTKWLGIVSSAITIILTIANVYLNNKIQQTEIELKKAQIAMQQKTQELEASKEKTGRYEFVNKLLPDILQKDKTRVILTTNLITLALTEDESKRLFSGFASSSNQEVQNIGKEGIETIKKQNTRYVDAATREKEGFDELINGNIAQSITAFEMVEQSYPTFHQAYEIAAFLKQNRNRFNDPSSRKAIYQKMVSDYSSYASKEQQQQLLKLSR
jgi:hypothetical protein